MRIINCEQGTIDWLKARVGIPTASQFRRIMTESKLLKSKQATEYAYELISERVTGEPNETGKTGFMERGNMLEDGGRRSYEFENDLEIEEVGFITNDKKEYGCSPDGLVGKKGLIEIKTPGAKAYVRYCIENNISKLYKLQRQAQLWITEREWCDIVLHSPTMKTITHRIFRDEEYIRSMEKEVIIFCELVNELERKFMKVLGEDN